MASPSVSIIWTYTDDPLVRAALGGFRVYPVDADYVRLAEAFELAPEDIPTVSDPLLVAMPPGATAVEVVPIDDHGYEGQTTYLPVQLGLPPVLHVAQIVMVVSQPPARHRH